MSGVRIIVMMVVFALCLSGWTAQVQALHLLTDPSSGLDGAEKKSDVADCLGSAASESDHDHSSVGHGMDSCHLTFAALDLAVPSTTLPGWRAKAAVAPVHPGAIAGIGLSPDLRPPRA